MTALLPRVRALIADRRTEDRSDAELLRAFVRARDEQAFAALVRRHGPLVRAAARRVVGNPADADDVFQATFLLLARNAAAVRNPAAVAGWLHGVATRMARTARRAAARRRAHEARAPEPRPADHCDLSWREVQQLFEDELARLPDRYRVPFVLCVLNAEPRADVAKKLGIREGTISSRLDVAKRRLQELLTGRGVCLAAVLGTIAVPTVAVSADLVERSVRAAAGGPVPAAVSALLRTGAMTFRLATIVLALAAAIGITLAAVGRSANGAGGDPPAAPKPPAVPVKEAPPPEKVAVRGTVLDADGKPVADAPVRLWSFRTGDKVPEPRATTDIDGKFRFDAAPGDVTDEARVVVTPAGRPAQWLPLSRFTGEQTLQIPKDDIPFTGRIASLENQPLQGVTVELVRVSNVQTGELIAWIDKNVAMRRESYWLNEDGLVPLPGKFVLSDAKTTTDADGKFRLTAFGRDRVLTVRVYGPNVETKHFWVVSRPGGPAGGYIVTREYSYGLYSPNVTVLLAPSRPLVGVVRDKKTGDPVAGIVVSEVNSHIPKAVTDKEGRYRIEGVPKKPHYGLNVAGAKGVPYFDHTHLGIADVAGLDPLATDLKVKRGVELTGVVVDHETGKPVRAEAMYFAPKDDEEPDDLLRIISSDGFRTRPDGTFYLTANPGKGVLCILAKSASAFKTVDAGPELEKIGNRSRPVGPVHDVIPLDLDPAKPETLHVRVELRAGRTVKGTVVGPDDRPLSGVKAAGFEFSGRPKVMESADFSITGLRPGPNRLVLVIHEAKKLGAVRTVSGEEADDIRIKLAPLGSATGQVLKGNKEPGAGFTVTAVASVSDARAFENLPHDAMKLQGRIAMEKAPWRNWTTRTAKADADGKFELKDLVPGLTYTVFVSDGDLGEPNTLVVTKRDVTVEAGKATELGELKKGP
jgi:RNA polymerase sigma factor (sigma-70 family)